jgi:hypothetical protein
MEWNDLLHAPAALTRGKFPAVHWAEPKRRSGRCCEEKRKHKMKEIKKRKEKTREYIERKLLATSGFNIQQHLAYFVSISRAPNYISNYASQQCLKQALV